MRVGQREVGRDEGKKGETMGTKKTSGRRMPVPPYGPPIQQAIASGSLSRMKAAVKRAEAFLGKHGDIGAALEVLKAEIAKLEGRG